MRTLSILFLLIFISCGTKKRLVHVSTSKEAVSLIQNNDITANLKTVRQNNTTIYEPIDKTLPMTLPDGRTAINTKIIETNTEVNKELDLTDKSTIRENRTVQKKDKDIDLDVTKPNPYLWISILIGFCFVLYLVYKYLTRI